MSSFRNAAAAAAKLLQSCPTLRDPMAAHQAPLSMVFSRQEYWSGLPLPSPISELKHHQMILEYLVIEERIEVLK